MMNSLRHRLLGFVLIVVMTLAAVLTAVAYLHAYAAAEVEVRNTISQITTNKVAFISEWVSSRQRIVNSVLLNVGQGLLKPVLDQARIAGGFDDCYLGEPDKTMTLSQAKAPEDYDPTGRPWYVAAVASEGPIASPPYIDATSKQPVMTFAQALRRNGQLVGVVGGDVLLKRVVAEVVATQLPGNGQAFLLA